MLNWLRDKRREKIVSVPFPRVWARILRNNISYYPYLSKLEKKRLRQLIQIFIAEKEWEGCNGLELTDEIRVTIAAQACLMILALPSDVYRRVESIYVYPSTVLSPERKTGFFEVSMSPEAEPTPVIGEVHYRGPVILCWDAVQKDTRYPDRGFNVVYHEFAHKLDMLDGKADGTPPLHTREQYQQWIEVCSRVFLDLSDKVKRGKPTFLDSYGATNEAEFFAVATESFFCKPKKLKNRRPALYRVLKEFYRQDPAKKVMNHQS